MKKLLLLALAACLPFSMAVAQQPDPANFHLIYGPQDGSVLTVGIDKDIAIQAWGATSPGPGDLQDSVNFMHMPLSSDDLIIATRTGGFFPPFGVGLWDDKSFLNPEVDSCHFPGYTSQSMLGFAYLTDPRSPENFLYTLGAFQLLCTFTMHSVNNPDLIEDTVCPFVEGCNPANGGLTWGMADGIRGVAPITTYPCLYFSPNQAPVFTEPTGDVLLPVGGCFTITAVDNDGNAQTVTIYGPDGFQIDGAAGADFASGEFCPDASGAYVFTAFDGSDMSEPFTVNVTVDCFTITAATLAMTCEDAVPGAIAEVFVSLQSDGCVGGFELLIRTDPTVLNLAVVEALPAINNGSEYFNHVADPFGPGTDRFVWVADVNNGVPGIPMGWNTVPENIVKLTFNVAGGLPWGMNIPIYFYYTDFTDNTISDETGYVFFHPVLVDGCVRTANPEDFAADPNMNCFEFEVADAVLVAQRLIEGYVVWATDDGWAPTPDDPETPWNEECDRHWFGNDPIQEAAADLNANGFADVADLVAFINFLNGIIFPKLDPIGGQAVISIGNGAVTINSEGEVGAVLVTINGDISEVEAEGMDVLTHSADGVTSVLVYSLTAERIAAGRQTVFTFQGEGTIVEASASDAMGRLLDATARQEAPLPTEFSVNPNYPNPFNAKTLINFALPTDGDVNINIYNITGQVVETINGHYQAGYHQVTWDASDVASGIYFAKIAAGSESQTVKMTLLK